MDPTDPNVQTSASLHDNSILPHNLRPGDVLRMEVMSSSPRHALLQIPKDVGFTSRDPVKKVVLLCVHVFGFVHPRTHKFILRPHAREFILQISRHYQLAAVSSSRGLALRSGLFSAHPLLFMVEEENELESYLLKYHLDRTNSFILDISRNTDMGSDSIQGMFVSPYSRQNSKDIELDISSDVCKCIMSIVNKADIGIHINEFNTK